MEKPQPSGIACSGPISLGPKHSEQYLRQFPLWHDAVVAKASVQFQAAIQRPRIILVLWLYRSSCSPELLTLTNGRQSGENNGDNHIRSYL